MVLKNDPWQRPGSHENRLVIDKNINVETYPNLFANLGNDETKVRIFLQNLETGVRSGGRVPINPSLVENQMVLLEIFDLVAKCSHRINNLTVFTEADPADAAQPLKQGSTRVQASIYGRQGLLVGPHQFVTKGYIRRLPCLDFSGQFQASLGRDTAKDLHRATVASTQRIRTAVHQAIKPDVAPPANSDVVGKTIKEQILDRLIGRKRS